jgi:hypothetical protein
MERCDEVVNSTNRSFFQELMELEHIFAVAVAFGCI